MIKNPIVERRDGVIVLKMKPYKTCPSVDSFIVDDTPPIIDILMKHKYHSCKGYPKTLPTKKGEDGKRHSVYLHQQVYQLNHPDGLDAGLVIDHINRNPTDDRNCNLRAASYRLNRLNTEKLNTNNISGVNGVSFSKKGQRWRAKITDEDGMVTKRRSFSIFRFGSKERAKEAAIEYINKLKLKMDTYIVIKNS